MALVVLIGASGSGKTAIAQAVAASRPNTSVFYFDDIGVPSAGEMIAEFGSSEAWQRAKTINWMGRLAPLALETLVLFEGQTRLTFLTEGAKAANDYYIVQF